MNGTETFLTLAANLSLAGLSIALVLTVYRVIAGPSLADRVLALDMMTAIGIGFMAVFAISTGFSLYVDIAVALALVGFLATVAFSRFIITRPLKKPPPAAGARPRPPRPGDRRIRR